MRQIQKWVVTTQNMRRKGRPYSYTAIAARDSYVRYTMTSISIINNFKNLSKFFTITSTECREGPGYKVNKATLLRQQQRRKLKQLEEGNQ